MTTNTWLGTVNNQFSTAGNWSAGHVPTASEEASISTSKATTVSAFSSSENVGGITIGSNDELDIDNGVTFTTNTSGDGGTNVINGELVVNLGEFVIGAGNLQGNGEIELASGGPVYFADLVINGTVSTSAAGSIDMVAASPAFDNRIESSSGGTFTSSEIISGTGIIGDATNLAFINDSSIDTDISGSNSTGTLQITGSAGNGSFTNNGNVQANNGGTLIFGIDSDASTIGNNDLISLNGEGSTTKLEIAGNVTIGTVGSSSPGDINLGGTDALTDDQIVSDGHAATLTLVNQMLKGAGTIGDSNLTLDNESGTIEVGDVPGLTLSLVADSTITNGPAGVIVADNGDELNVDGPINNSGTIVDNGSMFFEEPLSSSGTIDIGQGALLTAENTISASVTFTGPDATLNLLAPAMNSQLEVFGAVAGDQIGFQNTTYSSSMQLVWQQDSSSGTLTLFKNNAVAASVTLAGQYTGNDFQLVNDGWAAVVLPNPNPPSGTTADMIMSDGSGDYEIFNLDNNGIVAAYGLGQVNPEWQVAGVGGFDGTDTSDMMLRNSSTGAFEVYDIGNNNNTNVVSMGQVGLAWVVSGFADFSGNPGETDMLLQNSGTGAFEVYDISNNQISFATSMGQVGAPWAVAGFGDFSGNAGETGDMLMRNGQTGAFEVYDISDNTITFATSMGQVGLEWSVVGFGDFSGNGNETDMLMRDTQNGAFEIYDISNNAIYNDGPMGQVGLEWQVAGFGPIDGAGTSDMLMRNINTGAFEIYDIAGNQLVNAASMGQVGTEWSVAGIAADPPGASPANAQLAQAMASFSSAGSSFDAGSPLAQPAAQSETANPLAAANNHTSPAG